MAKKVRELELPAIVDETDGTVIYEGFPDDVSGITTATERWAIRKQTKVGTVWTTSWANGNQKKINAWDDRATLTYSIIPLFSNYQG